MKTIAKWCNLPAYPLLWLAVVISAAQERAWQGSVAVIFYLALHTVCFVGRHKLAYIALLAATCGYGWGIESLLKSSGAIAYSGDHTGSAFFAPLWVVLLYPLFAVSCSLFFGFMKKRFYLSATLGFLFGPLTYFNAYRLGAASFPMGITYGAFAVGSAWALSFPLLVWFTNRRCWYDQTLPAAVARLLDRSIFFSFDRSGFLRHSAAFTSEDWSGEGKVVLITGGNSGIGFATAQLMLEQQLETHLICRSRERGNLALKKLQAAYPNGQLFLHIADLSDRTAVEKWIEEDAPQSIDILVNNAGGMSTTLQYTEAGEEVTWATHLLGHYYLTSRLIEKGLLNEGARVITVASGGMYLQKLYLDDLRWEQQRYSKYRAYANAKRAQVILTQLWQEQFGDKIAFSCMHPGWVDTTGVEGAMPIFYRSLRQRLRTPEEGADTIGWLALTPTRYRGGELWFDRTPAPHHYFAFTKESAAERRALWDLLQSYHKAAH